MGFSSIRGAYDVAINLDPRLRIIFSRRSVRQYTTRAVSEIGIQNLLQAGMAAPSAMNKKPWHFVVVTNRDTLQALADTHFRSKSIQNATLGIAVCGDPEISALWVQDCTVATENILVAVSALGLGAVWLCIHGNNEREDAVRRVLEVPDGIRILSLLSIGYPGESKEMRTQFDPGRAHKQRW
jgi:nitroreductase